jgi:hypothetical protein
MATCKAVSLKAKVMVYRLSKTSPEVFDTLWTKTGKLNLIEETKAWKAANRVVGSHWTLDTPVAARQLSFADIVKKTNISSLDQSRKQTKPSAAVASKSNPYAKLVASWMKKGPTQKNISRTYTTFFELKLPPADLVELDIPTLDISCAFSFERSR